MTIALILMTIAGTLGLVYLGWKLHEEYVERDNAAFFNNFNYEELMSETPIGDFLRRKHNV